MACQEQQYQELLKDKFSVLDDVRKAGEDSDNSFTLSIGIARNERNLVTLSEMANSALDVALSRGGDQVVINSAGQSMGFYGGKTEAKAQRHRVKLKVMSKSLMTLFDSCKKVLIMGHRDADFDAIGACVAVYSMVEALNIPLFNSSEAIDICDNKYLTHIELTRNNLPTPKTIVGPKTFPRNGYNDLTFIDRAIEKLFLL